MTKKIIEIYGNYYDIGYQIGDMSSNKIKELIHNRYNTIITESKNNNLNFKKEYYDNISSSLISSLKNFTPNEYQELLGVSEGAGVNLSDIVFVLGYSDLFDLLFREVSNHQKIDECTSFISYSDCNVGGEIFAGQTWDMPPKTDRYTALFHKMFDDGKEIYSYSTIFGLTHMGINSNGICIGTTNVSTKDTGLGVIFPALIQAGLLESNIKNVLDIFKELPKVSGHYYYIVSPNQAYGIEVSAADYYIETIRDGIYVHTNHYKNSLFLKQAIEYSPTSRIREQMMEKTLDEKCGKLTLEDYKNILSSHEANICRHYKDDEKIPSETCGGLVFSPRDRKMYIVFENPCSGEWFEFSA